MIALRFREFAAAVFNMRLSLRKIVLNIKCAYWKLLVK